MEFPLIGFRGNREVSCELDSTFNSLPYGSLSFDEGTDQNSFAGRHSTNLEEHEILTSMGIRQRVYVQRSKSKRALITYHDIGTNHISFLGFFNHPEMRVILQHFTVYHVCAPGHHENAPNEIFDDPSVVKPQNQSASTLDNMTGGSRLSLHWGVDSTPSVASTVANYPTLDQLANMLKSLLVHFEIDCFLGFGMGAGSNILARYALHYPDSVLGLFLLNPTIASHSFLERMLFTWWDLSTLQQGVLTDRILYQLNNHWFGYGLSDNEDVVHFYHELARNLNAVNMAGYMRAFFERTPINLIRKWFPNLPTDPIDSEPTVIKTDVCLVTGALATDLAANVANMNGCMDPKLTQYLIIPDCTGMVMEENPDKLAIDFLHYLRSIGLLINLTPDKLHKEAIRLQVERQQLCLDTRAHFTPTQLQVANEA